MQLLNSPSSSLLQTKSSALIQRKSTVRPQLSMIWTIELDGSCQRLVARWVTQDQNATSS